MENVGLKDRSRIIKGLFGQHRPKMKGIVVGSGGVVGQHITNGEIRGSNFRRVEKESHYPIMQNG